MKDILYSKKADVYTYIKADFISHPTAVPHIFGILDLVFIDNWARFETLFGRSNGTNNTPPQVHD